MNPIFNLLYIGNNTSYFEIIKEYNNFSLTSVENSIAATNYLNSNKAPHANICEYTLPGNNGLFLFDWIRQHEKFNDVSFILLSKEFNSDIYKLSFKKTSK